MAASQNRPGLSPSALLNFRDWRIGPKLLTAFLSATTLPLILSGILSFRTSRDALLTQGITNLTARSLSTSVAIDQFLESHKEDVGSYMTLPPLATFISNRSDATAYANAFKVLPSLTNRKYYESVAMADVTGTIVLSSSDKDLNTSIKSFDYFQAALQGTNYISDPWVDSGTNQPFLYASAPILDSGGHILGVLVSRISFDGIWDLVDSDLGSVGAGTVGMLLDQNGLRIALSESRGRRAGVDKLLYTAIAPVSDAPAKQLIAEKRFGNVPSISVSPVTEIAAALADPSTTAFESGADDSSVRHYAVISTLKNKPWHYVLMTPLPTFTGAADSLALQIFLLVVVVTAFTCIVVIFIARSFTGPIVHLTEVADRISMGELDMQIGIERKDEIGQLAEAIGRMQASLQATMERLRASRRTP
jgi:HAMP domain-containing protein